MAAMTCPGVPTHKKRLRPAERVETESATYAECSSRSGSGGPLRRGRVAAQCRLSAPNAEGKQKRHCAIKLNANGRLDNLLSAICRSSPLEAGGGTIEQAVNKSRHQGRTDHLSRSRWRRGLVRSAMLKQARGKPDQTRSIPRKGYIWTIGPMVGRAPHKGLVLVRFQDGPPELERSRPTE